MKITQTKTPEDFSKITRTEFYELWFLKALTQKQMAKMYGVTVQEVKEKRKEFKLTMLNCGLLRVAGGDQYKKKGK